MVQLMPLHPKTPLSLASFKSKLVLPFWYRLTQAVLEKRPLNGCSSVVVVVTFADNVFFCTATFVSAQMELIFVGNCFFAGDAVELHDNSRRLAGPASRHSGGTRKAGAGGGKELAHLAECRQQAPVEGY